MGKKMIATILPGNDYFFHLCRRMNGGKDEEREG